MLKKIFNIIAFFIFGMAGGIFANQILWPYFVERPLFYQYNLERPPVYVTERNEITIEENVALQNAVEKVEKTVVGIQATAKTGKIIRGSGIVVTSDGLMVTLAELVPSGADYKFFVNGKNPNYQILKRDLDKNLALVKLAETNLPTIGFSEFGQLRLGERVFLVGEIFENNSFRKIVDEGIIRIFDENNIQTNISAKPNLKGSPLFDIRGRMIGLNVVDSEGKISAIFIKKIREFGNF